MKVLGIDLDEDFWDQVVHTRPDDINVDLFFQKIIIQGNFAPLNDRLAEFRPDVIVVNLDLDEPFNFGRIIRHIFSVPLASRPLILGYSKHQDLQSKKTAYEVGLDDFMAKPFSPHELWFRLRFLTKIKALQNHLDDSNRKQSYLNLQLSQANLRLQELTVTDELTGLHNMRFMLDYLQKHFVLIHRHPRPFSLMMIDLDHFKQVNEKNNHLVGSNTIRSVGHVIDECMRNTDVKARYGGDEYIIAMPETDLEGAKIAAERLLGAIRNGVYQGYDGNFTLTASVGVSTFEAGRHPHYSDIIKEADLALFAAKQKGRNQYVVYQTSLEGSMDGYEENQSAALTHIKKIAS